MIDSRSDLWAVVLADGEGVRLTGSTSLLRVTLDRVARLIPPERTVAVTQTAHAVHVAAELAGHPAITVLPQPCDRGAPRRGCCWPRTGSGPAIPPAWSRCSPPTGPEPDHGWIGPGELVGWAAGGAVRRIRAFHVKPPWSSRAGCGTGAPCGTPSPISSRPPVTWARPSGARTLGTAARHE